jgi:alkaline phosphatase
MFKLNKLTIAIATVGLMACSDSDNDSKNKLGEKEGPVVVLPVPVITPAPVVRTELTTAELKNNVSNNWYAEASSEIAGAQGIADSIKQARGSAKNIILFVGDGMGMSTITAARILDGQNKGQQGEENTLSFGNFPFSGLSKTYNVDAQTPDSAGTMTAMISGIKTDKGVIGIDEDVERSDCSSMAGNELITAIELAEIAGMSTGILSTARITHATPAATYAKSVDRDWEDNSDMPQEAIDAGCQDIAQQLVNFESNLEARHAGLDVNGLDVVMGGGRRHFLPKDTAFNIEKPVAAGAEGDRTDNKDLITEWKNIYAQGTYVNDQAGFDAIDETTTEPVLALFNESHMLYEADRGNDILGEPSLTEMTQKAINILDNNEKGFFLTVESGRIDHGHHAGSAYNALTDTIEFSNAIQAAVDSTNPEDTLILVTADHGHVFTISGYPQRGNPILGKVVAVGKTEAALAEDDKPFTTLAYANGRGFKDLGTETNADAAYDEPIVAGRVDLTAVNTTNPGFHQEATVPLSSETHSGEDVSVYASGPGAHLVNGTYEQSQIFHIMEYAGDLVSKADIALSQPAN